MDVNYIDLFSSGEGGYNSYRIPAIFVSPGGTVLVFCEGRKHSLSGHRGHRYTSEKKF